MSIKNHPTHRLWRSPIRVMDVEKSHFYIVLPGWDPMQKVRINFSDVEETIHKAIKPGAYLHAMVNIGAEYCEDLYFCDWENE